MTGDLTVPNLVVTGTVDGVDIAARDAVLTSTTTTAGAALPLAGGTITGDLTTAADVNIIVQGTHNEGGALLDLKGTDTPASGKNLGSLSFGNSTDRSLAMIRGISSAADAADMVFYTEATGAAIEERMRISSSGNVGIGTSAPVSLSSQTSLTINGTSVARIDLQGTGQIYANSTEVVLQGAYGKPVAIDAGTNQHISFRYATAEKMRLDSSGRLLLGTTSTYFADADDLVVAGSGNQGITIASGTSSDGNIFFADGTSGDARYMGIVRYNHSDNAMKFYTNGANERMRIDSSGQIIAGPFGGAGNAVIAGSSSPSYTNQAGTNLLLKSGDGSGTGSSFMSFSTSPAGSSGTTVNTATERMRIDSSGRVGIGTTTPTGKVEIQGPAIGSGNVDHDHFKALKLSLADGTEWGGQAQFSVGRWQEDGNNARSTLQLALGNGQQNSDSNADTVIFTALSHGRVVFSPTGAADGQGVTTYANGTNGHYVSVTGTSNYWITNHGVSSATGTLSTFYNNSTYCGGINISSTNVTSYVSASDYRLKENVAPMTGATERLKQLNPVTFDWINSGEASEGFLAHEVGAVVPISTTGTKDEVYDEESAADNPNVNEGDPKYQSVDPAKLVPLLVKTIQELEARITVLEGG